MAETKQQKAISLFRQGRVKEALSLFSRFRLGFTKEESRMLQIAYEMQTGNSSFYKALGFDCKECLDEACNIIRNKYSL